MESKLAQSCDVCGGLRKFAPVVKLRQADGVVQWRHEVCPKDQYSLAPQGVCPRCFMERSVTGDCGC